MDMIQEAWKRAIFVLQGVKCDKEDFVITPVIMELGDLVGEILKEIDIPLASKHSDKTREAFISGVRSELDEYFRSVSMLDADVEKEALLDLQSARRAASANAVSKGGALQQSFLFGIATSDSNADDNYEISRHITERGLIRTIEAWSAQKLPIMGALYALVLASAGLSGPQLATVAYNHASHGDPRIKPMLSRIALLSCAPIAYACYTWIIFGSLPSSDFHFFIVSGEEAENMGYDSSQSPFYCPTTSEGIGDSHNVEKALSASPYAIMNETLIRDRIPGYYSLDLAQVIYKGGKAMYFLRNLCNDNEWLRRNIEHFAQNIVSARGPLVKRLLLKLEDGLSNISKDDASAVAYSDMKDDISYEKLLLNLTTTICPLAHERHISLLLTEHRLVDHIMLLHKYLLLSQSDFSLELFRSLGSELENPAATAGLSAHELTARLENAIRDSTASVEPKELINRLTATFGPVRYEFGTRAPLPISEVTSGSLFLSPIGVTNKKLQQSAHASATKEGREDPDEDLVVAMYEASTKRRNQLSVLAKLPPTPQGWDIFSLSYVISGPLLAVLNKNSMPMYSILFRYLWRIRRMEYAVSSLFTDISNACHAFHKCPLNNHQDILDLLHSLSLVRFRMQNFVSSISNYTQIEVLSSVWGDFMLELTSVTDVEELTAAHWKYLHRILEKLLLLKSGETAAAPLANAYYYLLSFVDSAAFIVKNIVAVCTEGSSRARDEVREKAVSMGLFGNYEKQEEWGSISPDQTISWLRDMFDSIVYSSLLDGGVFRISNAFDENAKAFKKGTVALQGIIESLSAFEFLNV